jgi:hypothetical protein
VGKSVSNIYLIRKLIQQRGYQYIKKGARHVLV